MLKSGVYGVHAGSSVTKFVSRKQLLQEGHCHISTISGSEIGSTTVCIGLPSSGSEDLDGWDVVDPELVSQLVQSYDDTIN